MAGIASGGSGVVGEPADCDRFAHWARWQARAGLLAFVAMMVAAFMVAAGGAIKLTTIPVAPEFAAHTIQGAADPQRGNDLLLYDRVIRRLQAGEAYYSFIVEEQRLSGYPVAPGAAVRLPTLALLLAATSPVLQFMAGLMLLGALTVAWIYRLADEGIPGSQVAGATVLVMLGAFPLVASSLHVLHEVWASALLALAFAVHRPGRWILSLSIAALALSIRELVLPFVLLMATMAFYRRDWREGSAWSVLAAVFALAYAVHLRVIAEQVLPGDMVSASWFAMGGLTSWLTKLVLSSPLNLLPPVIGGPLVICAIVGWAGNRTPMGSFATLLLLGYGLAFMLAGRPENFYWGLLLSPVLLIGFAFAPRAIASLVRAAQPQEVIGDMVIACKRYVLHKRRA